MRIAVAGASGYAGGELLRLLLAHPEAEIGALTAGGSAGTRLGAHQPHLLPLADRVLVDTTPTPLPGTTWSSSRCRTAAPPSSRRSWATTCSWSTAERTTGSPTRRAWTRWYGGVHAGSWPYGLPELPGAREALRGARRIAVPGCYPTASTLALFPAFAAGLAEPEVVVTAVSGHVGRR